MSFELIHPQKSCQWGGKIKIQNLEAISYLPQLHTFVYMVVALKITILQFLLLRF